MTMAKIDSQVSERGLEALDRLARAQRMAAQERSALGIRAAGDSPWLVASVHSGRETAVENVLKDLGAEALVPMRKGKKMRRRDTVIEPKDEVLMTGYVLVRFCCSAVSLRGLLGLDHVSGVLGGWERPFPVTHEKACEIMWKAGEGVFDYERQSGVRLLAGDKVRVTEGLFANLAGVVVTPNTRGKGDVVLEIDFFGRMTPATLPLAILEKL